MISQEALPGSQSLVLALELVSRGMGAPGETKSLSGLVTPLELAHLLTYQHQAQRRANIENSDSLYEWIRRSMNDLPEVANDGLVAYNCDQGAGQYYGNALPELTQAQLDWFMFLRVAFENRYVGKKYPDGERRKEILKEWVLKQDREKRLAWQM